MPVRWQVGLDLHSPKQIQVQHLHHHACTWVEGPESDHRAPSKPFAISPLWQEGGQWAFDIALLDDHLEPRLADALDAAARHDLRLGPTTGCVDADRTGPVDACTWPDFVAAATPNRSWTVEFVTPFATRRGRLVQPYPAAQSVFGHLHRRWHEHARDPERNPLHAGPEPRTVALVESAFDGHTSDLYVRGTPYTGFVGTITYRLLGAPPTTARHIDQLARLLPYSGAGTMTTFGMGVARLLP